MKNKNLVLIFLVILANGTTAGIFSSKEGVVFQTRGEAVILRSSTFTTGIERRNIPIPEVIDIRVQSEFSSVRHDRESGWTQCRVPLKSEFGITGITDRSLVFDCKPIQYFQK